MNASKLVTELLKIHHGGILLINNCIIVSSNIPLTIVRMLGDIKEIEILEVENNPILRSIKAGEYTRKGFKGRNKPWKLSITPKSLGTIDKGLITDYKLFLEASNRYSSVVLGIFDEIEEAKEFKKKFYKNGIKSLTYANNKLTKEWYEKV